MPIYTSDKLDALLNAKVINEAFEIVRRNRIGVLSVVNMGQASIRPENGAKFGWLEGAIGAQGSTASGAALAAATTITVADGAAFRVGSTFSPEGSDEVILVTGVSGNDLTVTRGFGGTTAANIADGDALTVDGTGREENSLAATDEIWQPGENWNYFQTMDTAIEFSRRALATLQYGNTNDVTFQINERIRQLAIQMNRTLMRGRRAEATIGGKKVTYTGGMRFFNDQAGAIKDDASAAALTLDLINDVNEEIIRRGGMTDTIAVGLKQARKISALVSANYNSQRLADWTADEGSVLRLPSDMPLVGNVNTIVVDTNINDDELYIFESGKITVQPMAAGNSDADGGWRTLDATQKGQDGITTRVLGDYGMEIRDSQSHLGRILNLG